MSGRWGEQLDRLHATGSQRIFFVIEGDLRTTSLKHDNLLGACINAGLRKASRVIRTMDLEETVAVVRHLVAKGGRDPTLPPGLTPPMTRRSKTAERQTCWTRQLMCIPSISERIAYALLKEFRNLPAIKRALEDEEGIKIMKKIKI
eukprot:6204865-Karenia_brevis.AAC.1